MKLRVGVIGLGEAWESRHRPALRALSDRFEVRAVCEEVSLRAEQAARQFDAIAIDGYHALACRDDVDAILMLAPQWYGPLPILAACDSGKAVYCASTWDVLHGQLDEIRGRVDQSGIAFMAEFPRRVAPATLRLKELIATQLGPPRLLFCHHRRPVERRGANHGPRRNRYSPSTQVLLELIDWCHYVVGHSPGSVSGFWHRRGEGKQHDYQVLSLDFSAPGQTGSGPLAQISCGNYMPAAWHEAVSFRPPAALQVCCENGIAFVDLPAGVVWFDQAGRHMESLDTERPIGEQLLSQFHRAVVSFVRNNSGLEDAFRALKVLVKAKESFANGQRMTLEW